MIFVLFIAIKRLQYNLRFLSTSISQLSVVTRSRCGGIFNTALREIYC